MVEDKVELSQLLKKDFLQISSGNTVEKALEKFKDFDTGGSKPSIYYVYIVDGGELKGVVSVNDLLSAKESKNILEIATTDLVTVNEDESMEEVARKMSRYDYQAFPVLKQKGEIKGIVRLDDMLEVMENEASEDIFKKAGFSVDFSPKQVTQSKDLLDSSVFNIIRIRLPWLLFALIGGLAAGEVIHTFEQSLTTLIALAFFIPVIMDMGGNVGTQASTIFVRGAALGQIDRENVARHIAKESLIGLIIGGIVGALAGLFAFYRYGEPIIGLVLLISMSFTCLVASLIGFLVPWTAKKIGYDPAAVSDPMITSIKDITALLVYFSSAYLLLGI